MGKYTINTGAMKSDNGGSPRYEHVVGIGSGTIRHESAPMSATGDGKARYKQLGAMTAFSTFDAAMSTDPLQAVQVFWSGLSGAEKAAYHLGLLSGAADLA